MRFSENIHGNHVRNPLKLLDRLERRQPNWTLVMDNLDLATQVKARGGSSGNVIFRAWPDDGLHTWKDAETWALESKARIGGADLWLYAGNEPGWSATVVRQTAKALRVETHRVQAARASILTDEGLKARFSRWWMGVYLWLIAALGLRFEAAATRSSVRWAIEVIHAARKYGLKVVVLNLSSGTPNPDDWKQPLALELLRLLDTNRDMAVLGLHEYACGIVTSGFVGGWPSLILPEDWPPDVRQMTLWHLGRYMFLVRACEAAGIAVPRIVITEFGFDDMSDVKAWAEMLVKTPGYASIRGWRSLVEQWRAWFGGWSAERTLFEMIRYALQVIYWHSAVEGVLWFCEGASSPVWEQFNKEGADEFESLWDQAEREEEEPVNVPEGGNYYRQTQDFKEGLILRKDPGTAGERVGLVKSGDILFVKTTKPETANGHIWKEVVQYRDGKVIAEGFVATTVDGLHWGQPVDEPTPPPPLPEPPPQENWRGLLSEMERDVLRVAAAVTAEPALAGYVSLGYNTDVALKLLHKVAGIADGEKP